VSNGLYESSAGSGREIDPADHGVGDVHVEVTARAVGRGLAGVGRGVDPVQAEGPGPPPQPAPARDTGIASISAAVKFSGGSVRALLMT
jgi:hypothetical protein